MRRRRIEGRRLVRFAGLGLALTALLVAALVVPPWVSVVITPPMWRRAVIRLLEALLVADGMLLVAAPAGVVLFGVWLARARRLGRGRMAGRVVLARGLLLSSSCLIGLALAEAVAAAWQAWIHRAPALTSTFQAPVKSEPTLPDALARAGGDREAAANEVNIVVIGGSSAFGVPYDGYLSVGEIVGWQLRRAFPGRTFRIEVLAQPAAPLELMHQKLARLTRRPDVLIIYSGHNEFFYYDNWQRTVPYYVDELDPRSYWSLQQRIERATPLRALIAETLERKREEIAPPSTVTRWLIERPTCSPAEYAYRVKMFRARLETIVAFCERVGCLPVLLMPPGNDGGFEPNRSVLAPETTKPGREAIAREFRAARAREATDPEGSMRSYRDLLARQPTFAEAHFRLARRLEASGAWSEANQHYILARDHDGAPLRCPEPFLAAYRAVAARHPDAILIDGPAVLRTLSPHGILDDPLFNDAMHPSLRGHVALAQAVLEQLYARRAFGWPQDADPPVVDPAACAAHFRIDANAWATVCERSAWYIGVIAYVRFDPTERLAKAHRFEEAARRIAAGTPPEATGVPGIGIRSDDVILSRPHEPESRPADPRDDRDDTPDLSFLARPETPPSGFTESVAESPHPPGVG